MKRIKRKHRNAHMWKVELAIVMFDEEKEMPRVLVKIVNDQNDKWIRRKLVFDTKETAEKKCDYWNHWNKYHKDYRRYSRNN